MDVARSSPTSRAPWRAPLAGRGRGAVKGGWGVLVAERAIGVLGAGVEQHLELVARAVRRFADEGKLVGLCVDRDRNHLAGLAVEVLVELHQPVGRRLHSFHQLFPGGAVRAQPQNVEQEGLLGRARGAGENEQSDGGGEAHRKSWLCGKRRCVRTRERRSGCGYRRFPGSPEPSGRRNARCRRRSRRKIWRECRNRRRSNKSPMRFRPRPGRWPLRRCGRARI